MGERTAPPADLMFGVGLMVLHPGAGYSAIYIQQLAFLSVVLSYN